jgi:hypothetical protein
MWMRKFAKGAKTIHIVVGNNLPQRAGDTAVLINRKLGYIQVKYRAVVQVRSLAAVLHYVPHHQFTKGGEDIPKLLHRDCTGMKKKIDEILPHVREEWLKSIIYNQTPVYIIALTVMKRGLVHTHTNA